jgi:hypothetical protein
VAKELVWLEDNTFAAWGCAACNWILPSIHAIQSDQPSTTVRKAFDKHDCAQFPRNPSAKEKRPSRSCRL